MNGINEQIRNHTFRQLYLLYGEEQYLVQQYKQKLKTALIGDDTMNYSYFEGSRIDVKELTDTADTMPFFAERRLVVVENSGFLKNAAAELADYLKKLPDYLYLLFVESEVDKRNRIYKLIKDKGYVCEMKTQPDGVLIRWIEGRLKKEGKTIDRAAVELLLSKTGVSMNLIDSELEKLICYCIDRDRVTSEDIEAIVATQVQNKIFDMITAIATRHQKKALDLYYDLLVLKEPPMRILYLITRQFNMMLQVKELLLAGENQATMAKQLGIAGFLVSKYIGQSKGFSQEEIMEVLEYCINAENDVKTGQLDEKLAVELVIIRYSRR